MDDISTLQALASQTAIALANVLQANRLRSLYQLNVGRHEQERIHIARELHDDLINSLGAIAVSPGASPEDFRMRINDIIARLRRLISGLRPKLLDFGVRAALDQIADDVTEHSAGAVEVIVTIAGTDARFDPEVEQHLYRIVQQAAENAVGHGQAKTIRIRGRIETGWVDITVDDDGRGFDTGGAMDLTSLLGRKQYGLVNMRERAASIGAELKITSQPGKGTQVRILYRTGSELRPAEMV